MCWSCANESDGPNTPLFRSGLGRDKLFYRGKRRLFNGFNAPVPVNEERLLSWEVSAITWFVLHAAWRAPEFRFHLRTPGSRSHRLRCVFVVFRVRVNGFPRGEG